MKKKVLFVLLCGVMLLGMIGCGKVKSESTIKDDLDKIVKDHVEADRKAGGYGTMTIKDLKNKLDSYSNYQLLDKSTDKFTEKPTNPTYIIKQSYEADQIQTSYSKYDRYFLIYDKDSDSYYSVKCDWDKEKDVPIFTDIVKLD